MFRRFRIFAGMINPSTATPSQPTPDDDDEIVNYVFRILFAFASFLLLLLCIAGIYAIRSAWIRWFSDTFITSLINHFSKAKLLRSIPKLTYSAESMADIFPDCAVCLTEFVVGDKIRVLPPCGHCFHVMCIDKWIGSHFTCPSCRQTLLKTTRCNLSADELPVTGVVAGVTGIQSTAAG